MHLDSPASPWVRRFAPLAPEGSTVLDLACGAGRHARLFLERDFRVVAVDRDTSHVQDLEGRPGLEVIEVDLEDGRNFPFSGRRFGAVVVTNYLHRPILSDVVGAVAPGGVLIYETFATGNARFDGPSRPDFLLRPAELLEAVKGRLRVVAYEDLVIEDPRPVAVQRIAAVNRADAPLVPEH
ncbi:MAG: class I SAM-dependent methyltransferase [Actinobacteria bacterium]|nr:class I SAM-dependent methyltransferase [Actinomycetota bacterium]